MYLAEINDDPGLPNSEPYAGQLALVSDNALCVLSGEARGDCFFREEEAGKLPEHERVETSLGETLHQHKPWITQTTT
jgi:hypothetical protein